MRILFIYLKSFSGTGGIENYTKSLIKAMQDSENLQNVKVTIISLYDNKPDKRYVYNVEYFAFSGNRARFGFAVLKYSFFSDVIIIGHINLLLLGIIIRLLGKRRKMALLIYGIEAWKNVGYLRRYFLNSIFTIISISAYTRDKFAEINNINSDKFKILKPCLDPFNNNMKNKVIVDQEILSRYGIEKSSPVIILVARLCSSERYKGYENVIKAIKLLKNDYPNIKFLIVGSGDEIEISRVNRLIWDLDLSQHVCLTGYVPDEELNILYNCSDIFVLPSTGEGFGIVFIEALSFGLPVIAGDRDASKETLMEGELGILVNPDDVDEISNSIASIINGNVDSKLLNSEYLRKEVNKYYSYKTFLNNFDSIIKSFG